MSTPDKEVKVPDVLSLVPDTDAGKCLRYCLGTLRLSIKDAQGVLYDAHKTAQAINWILSASLATEVVSEKHEEYS